MSGKKGKRVVRKIGVLVATYMYFKDKRILDQMFLRSSQEVKPGLYSAHLLSRGNAPWTLFLKTLCIFSKNKATLHKVSHGSGQKCSKELKNHSFTSVGAIVVKLQ